VKVIDRHIGLSLLAGCLPVLVLLVSLFSLLALSQELDDVGEGIYEISDALLVVALGLPVLVVDLLPVTVLLGGLLGLGALASNLEFTSLRAAAISPIRLAVPVASVAAVLILVAVLLQNQVIPQLAYYSSQLKAKIRIMPVSLATTDDQPDVRDSEFWTRTGDQFVRIGRTLPGRRLSGVEIYQFDTNGELTHMVHSVSAELLLDDTWQLQQVQQTQLQRESSYTEIKNSMIWEGLLSEEQTHAMGKPASQLAPVDLWRLIQRLDQNAMSSSRHRVLFWKQMSILPGLLGMALLSLPFLLGSMRNVHVGQRITLGGVIGISYYLIQQISGHAAGILQWNIAATVLAPAVLILSLSVWLLWKTNVQSPPRPGTARRKDGEG
jgi:lipopolysaccharide export system permease protein